MQVSHIDMVEEERENNGGYASFILWVEREKGSMVIIVDERWSMIYERDSWKSCVWLFLEANKLLVSGLFFFIGEGTCTFMRCGRMTIYEWKDVVIKRKKLLCSCGHEWQYFLISRERGNGTFKKDPLSKCFVIFLVWHLCICEWKFFHFDNTFPWCQLTFPFTLRFLSIWFFVLLFLISQEVKIWMMLVSSWLIWINDHDRNKETQVVN